MGSSILIPIGKSKPSVKSMSQAAFDALTIRPVYIPKGGVNIPVVTGFRFAAASSDVSANVEQQLVRHNKGTMTVEAGITWDSVDDTITPSAVDKIAKTAEVQLPGAFFKGKFANFDIGVFGQAQVVSAPFAKFYSLRTQEDDTITSYPFVNDADAVVGFELETDALVLKHNDTILHSYPLTYNAVVAGGSSYRLGATGSVTSLSNVPYSQALKVWNNYSGHVSLAIGITDNYTGANTSYTTEAVDILTITDQSFNQQVGQNVVINLADYVDGGTTEINPGYISWEVIKGTLPDGLALLNNQLVGTYTKDGEFSAVLLGTDLAGQTIEWHPIWNISPLSNVTILPKSAEQNRAYSYKPTFPYGFESVIVASGALPEGLDLDPATGLFSGVVTGAEGEYTATLEVTVNGSSETIDILIPVFAPVEVSYQIDSDPFLALIPNSELSAKKGKIVKLAITGGSGKYIVSANNGALVGLNYTVELTNAGQTVITVIDGETGYQQTFTVNVTSQDAAFAYATEVKTETTQKHNRPLITEVGKMLTVAFAAWTTQNFNTSQLIRHTSMNSENFRAISDGTPFAMYEALTNDARLQMPRSRNFLSELVMTDSIFLSQGDVELGLGRWSEQETKYSLAITTVNGVRQVELRERGNLITGTRTAVYGGQVVGFGVIGNGIGLYIDGALVSTVQGNNIEGLDFIVSVGTAGVMLGGQIPGLTFSLVTEGTANAVGSIHPQTGQYTPGTDNVSRVRVKGGIANNPSISYEVDILVLRQSIQESLAKARMQNRELKLWVADIERGDSDKLRITENGTPDANQIRNAVYVGTLKGSGKWDVTEKRTDFANDVEIYDTGHTIQKYTITGDVLSVLSPQVLKALVPYIQIEDDEIGTLSFSQFSTGCIPRKRIILMWKSSSCSERTVWDAMEFHNAKSYTPYNVEIGTEVGSSIPMSIEAYPEENTGKLFTFYRYDSQYVLI